MSSHHYRKPENSPQAHNHRSTKFVLAILSSALIASLFAQGFVMPLRAFAESVVTYIDLPNGASDTIAVNPETNIIYADSGNSIVAIDGSTNAIIATIPVDSRVNDIKINPDTNRIYVSTGSIKVIDGSTNEIVATIQPNDQAPSFALAINPSTNRIYSNNVDFSKEIKEISIIDGSSNEVLASMTPTQFCIFADMSVNPVTNVLYATECSGILVVDLDDNSVISSIPLDSSGVWGIDTNPNTNMVYAGVRGWDKGGVYAIDGSTNTQVARPFTGADTAEVAVNPNTNTIYNANAGTLFAIDGSTNAVVSQTPLELGTNTYVGVAVNPSTNMVYVSGFATDNMDSGKIAVIDADGDTSTASTSSHLTVNSRDTAANPIYGYYTILSQNGAVQDTGFTPATFTLNNDERYTVEVQDYGQYTFDHWADTASTDRDRSISISSDTGITAIYRNVNSPPSEQPPDEQTPEDNDADIMVKSVDSHNNAIDGYYTTLSEDGQVIDSGFTPETFSLVIKDMYTISVADYGDYVFDHWAEDGSTDRDKLVSIACCAGDGGSLMFTAVYRNINEQATESPEQPPEQTTDTISVTTVDSSGNQIYGYYTTLSQNGNVVQSAFSPAEFTVNTGTTYQVAVADYGQYVFDHWSDGSYDRFHNAMAGDSLTAVYRP